MDLEEMLSEIQNAQTKDQSNAVRNKYEKPLTSLLQAELRDKERLLLEEIVIACIRSSHPTTLYPFIKKLLKTSGIFNWKANPEILRRLFDAVCSWTKPDGGNQSKYKDTASLLMTIAENHRLLSTVRPNLCAIVEKSTQCMQNDHPMHGVISIIAYGYPWKSCLCDQEEEEKKLGELLDLMFNGVARNPSCFNGEWKDSVESIMSRLCRGIRESMAVKLSEKVINIFNFCRKESMYTMDTEHKERKKTICFKICEIILDDFLPKLRERPKSLKPFMRGVRKMWNGAEPRLHALAHSIMLQCADNFDLIGDDADVLIDLYLTGQEPSVISSFTELYKEVPKKFHVRLEDFTVSLTEGESWSRSSCLMLFKAVATKAPDQFSPEMIKVVASFLDDGHNAYAAMTVLQSLAEVRPRDVAQYDNDVISAIHRLGSSGICGAQVLIRLGTISEDHARKYCNVFADLIQTMDSQTRPTLLYYMRIMGQYYPAALEQFRPLLLKLKQEPPLKDSVQACLDTMDGRSLETMYETLAAGKTVLDDLESRIEVTQDNMDNLAREVVPSKQRTSRDSTCCKCNSQIPEQMKEGPELIPDVDTLIRQSWPHVQPLVEQLVEKHTQPLREMLELQGKQIQKLTQMLEKCKCK